MTMSKAWSKVIIFEYHYMVLSSENCISCGPGFASVHIPHTPCHTPSAQHELHARLKKLNCRQPHRSRARDGTTPQRAPTEIESL